MKCKHINFGFRVPGFLLTMSGFWKPGTERPGERVVLTGDRDEDDVLLAAAAGGYQSGYMNLQKQRNRLPIHKHRTALLYMVETTATVIVIGETGCGKTTQIPQYLCEAGWADGGRVIACTQPRRLAVQTVAARVAEEMSVSLGAEVGYSIRFEDITTPGVTKIKYVTDGVLVKEMMEDPLLTKYSVIMIDEAHERSIATDIVLGLLKKIQRKRPELRLIVSSATLQAKSVANFFDLSQERKIIAQTDKMPNLKPAIVSVQGRMHPVRLYYSEEPVENYIRAAVTTVLLIHKLEPPGDVLVFLTGQDDVDKTVEMLNDEAENLPRDSDGLFVLALYAGLSRSDQDLVFSSAPRGKRKVIVSTNIAETSVTLEGIVYVVDSGFSKQRFYNPLTDMEALVVSPISRASAMQRSGRAGRVRPGKCYRLYTENTFLHEMDAETVPEIQRSNLVSTILQLKALGIDNIMRFDWPAPPPPETMVRALELLYALGVLDTDAKLTSPVGYQIAEIPLDPMISKMLIASASLGCSSEALTIAATLSVQSIWLSSRGRQKELDEARDRFAVAEGDLVTYLNVYEGFVKSNKSPQWCHTNFVNYQAMKKVADVRAQLRRLMQRLGVKLTSCENEMEVLKKAIASGFFVNASLLQETSGEGNIYKRLRGGQELLIHPSSVLFRAAPRCVVFHSVMFTGNNYMRDVTAVDPGWLTSVAPHFFERKKLAV
ncbi:probable pre-mRNA-splicing factor ATP-dependent RNA helicase DEAH9 [Selaginella moellendorffii]|uniref:probable pre-mRNA-splicing factor ATP-dependent RNA helicase DEAH9 n=1 Tax=Selaginella moellendorffii TaxID=88036 RepID=UPI000D1C7FA6|nr:probable pre-mRNA-splicing factor ATP-dependent RNA helicase DEAH9 [Selaginella moellendorffii]XP_002984156.2 probable pre-mRNA-splicing factor ATP-dependent RNA helicase DEAH9 [Selaginella moellendorffii]|eukprot:XP_002972242.2 probable pre-mRNA-splicing factor ATP-dependent RNA helicase DEAH9 [Selaginella moellendorffii]